MSEESGELEVPENDNFRRIKRLRVGMSTMIDIINFCSDPKPGRMIALPRIPEIPEGAVVVGINGNFWDRCIELHIHHESYPACPNGAEIELMFGYGKESERIFRMSPEMELEQIPEDKIAWGPH